MGLLRVKGPMEQDASFWKEGSTTEKTNLRFCLIPNFPLSQLLDYPGPQACFPRLALCRLI